MSGGKWGYMSYRLDEHANWIGDAIRMLAKAEQIVDWGVCGDSSVEEAGEELFTLVREFFDDHQISIGR